MKTNRSFSLLCRCLQTTENEKMNTFLTDQIGQPDWYAVARVADSHFVTPLLYHRLFQKGLLAFLPEDLQLLLAEVHRLNRLRNNLIYNEINRIANLVNPVGIEPIFLKGSAALLMGLYEDRGLRVMNDVDFLVSKKDLLTCMGLMRSVGYRSMDGVNLPVDFYHQNPLVHDRHSIRFEIHDRLDQSGTLESQEIIAESVVIQLPDGVIRVPSVTHFTIHNILHSQVSDNGLIKGRVPLYQLYDLFTVRERYTEALVWESAKCFFTRNSLQNAFYFSLGMLRKYFKLSPPTGIRFLSVKMIMLSCRRTVWHIKHRCNSRYARVLHRCYQVYVRCRSYCQRRT